PVDEEWFSERGKKTSAFETPKNAAQDDIHDDDMGVGDGFMQNAPALPKPPRFKVSTKAERRRFMEEYNLYINQTNALTANGVRPFIMPVEACIDPGTKHRLATWDFGKSPDDVTEAEWISWLNWRGGGV
ncbi:unnamed protein product, partial [Aphanomyces euteiches]